jgi:hypothetical protein
MKCPTEKQITEAAKTSKEARKVLEMLFPELFESAILPGQIYKWGTDSDGNDGVVIHNPAGQGYSFVNYRTGHVYIPYLPKYATKDSIRELLGCPSIANFRGPRRIVTWTTK